uniref:NmrA-like family domain-containing protein 1 n=1 Tax=Leptobrachium leishanense TaxID=445787 RepID=A0A8C5R5X3_9ANUR
NTMKQIITVFGATGECQGGSETKALIEDGTFCVRAVTRDTCKPAGKKLKEAGAEVVAADMDNKESLEAALSQAYGAFVVTNFWEHLSKDKEITQLVFQGKQVADMSKNLGLKHVIFSGEENVKKLTGGKLEVLNCDGKGEVEEFFREIGVPMTSVRIPFYFKNFLTSKPQKSKDGKTYDLGEPVIHMHILQYIGPIVLGIFKSPSDYIGKDIGLSAEKLTVEHYAAIMCKFTGKTIRVAKVRHLHSGPSDLYEGMIYRDPELTHKLNPKTKLFQQWFEENKDAYKDF